MLLALQLMLGFQLQAIQAVASPAPMAHTMSAHASSAPELVAGPDSHVAADSVAAAAVATDADVTAAAIYTNVTAAATDTNVTAATTDGNSTATAIETNVTAAATDTNVTAAPTDGKSTAAAIEANATAASDNASGQPHCPQNSTPHDCCHASACQCHCVYTPGAIALPTLANIAASASVPSLATTQLVAPRIDEFLRPPIA